MAKDEAKLKTLLRADAGRDRLVVFSIRKETTCSECGRELWGGDFLRKEGDKALCIACADLDHLEFLPSGDAALTRRASKHSRLWAVVVRWSYTRKQYERQGILVEPAAIERAEQECLADAEQREARKRREAARWEELDQRYVEEFGRRVRERYPGCPEGEEKRIAEHACRKYSGRVGRSAAAKEFSPEAIDLAVMAHVRHRYTQYDELLVKGYERWEAREMTRGQVDKVLRDWLEDSSVTEQCDRRGNSNDNRP